MELAFNKVCKNEQTHLFSNTALKAMILPLLLEQLLQAVVGLADATMVSYAGQTAVSGVSLDTMIYTVFLYLFSALAAGGSVIISQYLGAGNDSKAKRTSGQLFLLAAILSLLCMGLMLIGYQPLLNFLYGNIEPDVMASCRTYLLITALSFPACAIYHAGAAVLRSQQKTKTTLYVAAAMNLVNIIGNSIGIFVFHAGIAGAAWPTVISWYAASILIAFACMKNGPAALELQHFFTIDPLITRQIAGIAVPNALENSLFQLSKVVLGSLTALFGTSQIAANGIGQTIWTFAALTAAALPPVFITVIGSCMGAGNIEEAKYYLKKLTVISLRLAFFWNMAVLALMPLILMLFSIPAETRNLVWIIVIIHNLFAGLVQPFSGPLSAGLRAAGDVKFSLYSSIFCTVIVRVALSFLFGLQMKLGVIGIALAMVIDWSIKAILDWRRFTSMKWSRFHLID